MATLRNRLSNTRRTHKERSQPADRKHLGFLEKHQDYSKRAKDHNKKKDKLRLLQEKAAFRNPDEFYFQMKNSKTDKDGVHQLDDREHLSADALKLLKSQDMSYITLKKTADMRKAEKLKASLHMLSDTAHNTHTIYVDGEAQVQTWDAAEHFDTEPELAERAFNRPRKETLREAEITKPLAKGVQKKAMKAGMKKYQELSDRMSRVDEMEKVRSQQQLEKSCAGKGQKKKMSGGGESGAPAVYKWKRQRTR
jgi:U3 small nucleolar RNA-associated protein 11